MPAYRENEKARHIQHSQLIFGPIAGRMGGKYNQIERLFCLPDNLSSHNLHESIRLDAINYFLRQKILWHHGHIYIDPQSDLNAKSGSPSNHVCCSQSQCVKVLFPFRHDPDALRMLLNKIGFDVSECLPILNDHAEHDAERLHTRDIRKKHETN